MYGIGFCGLKHPHVFDLIRMAKASSDVKITGAFEENTVYSQRAVQQIGGRFYSSYDQLLNDPQVQIVAIGDAYGNRGREVIAALKAGKHVLSDKPLCTRPKELIEIKRLCREKGCAVGCMLDLRYDPALRMTAKMVEEDIIGEVHAINFTGQHPLNYGIRPQWYFDNELHGGTFNDLIIHGIDAISYITGLRGLKVQYARNYNAFAKLETEFRDCAQMLGEYENGAGVIADVSYSAPTTSAFLLPSYWRFSFWGDKGMIECKFGAESIMLAENTKPIVMLPAEPIAGNCLDDLIIMMRGKSGRFSQESIFESTAIAQMIQARANALAMIV